jgi:cytochrome c553
VSTEPTKPGANAHSEKEAFGAKAVALIGATAVLAWGLSFVVIPIIQGRQDGFDIFASMCRAIGIPTAAKSSAEKPTGGPSRVILNSASLDELARGDPARGAAIAVDACVACHNANGLSADSASIPSITGQSARAIYKQLWDIKNGSRVNEIMKPILDDLDGQQIIDLAAYYSGLKSRNHDIRNLRSISETAINLVTKGDASRALPPCAACHESRSGGPLETPSLVGQYPNYLSAQLQAFAGGQRRNDLFARMRTIAGRLTPEEIAELSAYYDGPF